jgi:hypothetical protein
MGLRMHNSRHTVPENILWGLGWSSKFVVAYSLIATAIFIFAGPPPSPFSFPKILLTYVVTGAVAGILVGRLRPTLKTRIGATFCGIIVGLAIYVGGGISLAGFGVIHDPGALVGLTIAAIVVRGFNGSKWWKQDFDRRNDLE